MFARASDKAGHETQAIEPVGDAITTPTDTASTARRQVHLETLETIAEQVGEFELAIARMANDPAMDVGQAPELLGEAPIARGTRRGDPALSHFSWVVHHSRAPKTEAAVLTHIQRRYSKIDGPARAYR